jgi:exocyst complex protein 7
MYVQAEREIQKGPHENLQSFLDAVDRLRSIERFFSSNRSYSSSDRVLSHVNALLSKALVKMEGEFQNQLSQRRFVVPHYRFKFASLPLDIG